MLGQHGMHAHGGLGQCSKAASLGGTLSSRQEVGLTTMAEASQHGVAMHGMQPSHLQDATSVRGPALQPGGNPPAKQASSLRDDSSAGCNITPVKGPSSGSAASFCKVGSELSGRRAKQKQSDLCSVDIEEQARGAEHAAHTQAHLEWAQHTGYLAGEEICRTVLNCMSSCDQQSCTSPFQIEPG